MVILAPTEVTINAIHDAFMKQYGCQGYMCEGMVNGCLERAMTYVYEFQPFPKLFLKAAAILYSFIVFHPFVDGNKRTAFETTRIFLRLNGYELIAPKDGVGFTRAIADQKITDINEIARWLRKYSKRKITYLISSWMLKFVLQSYYNTPKEKVHLFPKQTILWVEAITIFPD